MQRLARDIMTRDVITVPTDMDLRDLAHLFIQSEIAGAPVVDTNGDIVGVISLNDLVFYNLTRDDELRVDSYFYQNAKLQGQHVPKGFQIEDCNTGKVSDVMTPMVHSVSERATLPSIARKMANLHLHRLIVRRREKVVGIISATDLLRVIGEQRAES
ncbi:MAG: CBS domain-containing protein [Gammaproteobacteria bacterium]|nr:CBS domain-containing protein [Gammaproteobacteria bacterium]MDH3466818.1 CBS domain-containing protein [Gammaproteobacteria bacterium]